MLSPEQSLGTRSIYSIGALGGAIRGYELGVVAGVLLFAVPAFHMTPAMTGWVVSAALLGSLVGAVAAGAASDRIGRRNVISIAALIFSLGILAAALSPNVSTLILSRAVLGFAVGIATAIIPLYLSEIAPARVRGAFSGLFQVMIAVGVLASSIVAFALAPYGAWRWMIGFGIVPAVPMLIGAQLLPESPRWLVERGRQEEASRVLEQLRKGDIQGELEAIKAFSLYRKKENISAMIDSRQGQRLLFVGCSLGMLQQLVGINAVTYYAPSLLKKIGFADWSAVAANLIISTIGLLATMLMLLIVDRFGRRIPLMCGALGMACSMTLLGGVVFSDEEGMAAAFVAVAALVFFQICFALSWGGIVWVVLGEMFPLRMRANAMGAAVFATEITSVVVSAVFPVFLARAAGVMLFGFAAMGVLAFVWVFFMVPETGGRSLEEIEAEMFNLRI